MIRALQVVDNLGMGGAETWLMEVLRLWSRTGEAAMDFLVTGGRTGLFDDEAHRLGARLSYVEFSRRKAFSFARELRNLLSSRNYDAIHDHQDYASGWHFAMGVGRLPPIRVTHVHNPVYQIRNNYGVTLSRRWIARAGKGLVARLATHVTGTSRQVIAEYGFDERRFGHISRSALHCGFDTSRFAGDRDGARSSVRAEMGWAEGVPMVLFAGRMDQSPRLDHPQNHKNSAFAVEVALEVLLRIPEAHFVFAGQLSPAVPKLQERVASEGRAGHVAFVGVRRDIERLMLAADVLLFPSRGEGLGMVAVEAQSAGLQVLASSAVPRECVVVPDLVRFLDLDQAVQRWAHELADMLRHPVLPGDANVKVARSPFGIENSAAALKRLYATGAL